MVSFLWACLFFLPSHVVSLPSSWSSFDLNQTEPEPTSTSDTPDPTGDKNGLICANFATASKNDVVNMLRDFTRRFPASNNDTCGAPGLTCTRQYCKNTSGLYFCNDNLDEVSINCADMAAWFEDVSNQCCTTGVLQSKGISGQQFSTNGWNVVVAYANCNHDPSADRPSDFAQWGPNGQCMSGGI